MTKMEIIQILTGCLGSLGFAILFNIRGRRLAAAALGGLLSWALFVVLSDFLANEAVNYFLVALVMSLYAEVMARVLKTPTTTFITPALVPLIPGGSLYYTMSYAFAGEADNFVQKGIATLQLASALALGVIIAAALTKMVCGVWERKGKATEL